MRNFSPLLILIGLLLTHAAFSQGKIRGSIKGHIIDSAGKQVLSEATVSITPESDTTDSEFAVADKNGNFGFKSLAPGTYHLLVTFEGYHHVIRKFIISAATKDIDFATINMLRASDMLQEVVIQRPPMQIKKDTIEYNAEMYATKPNAFVEDQLKKLPGVEVDASGNIIAQGEAVVRVQVNGKRFFNDDPKLATRNIPPDIVERYQIFDDLDDQSKFTGIDDGNRVKTLNIITKKDKRIGYFGRAIAGIGTNQDYDESFNFHRFNNDQQISALGQGNDVKQNFTIQDVLGSSGGRRGSGGGPSAATNQSSPGITTVWAGGANYHDDWGPKYEAYGSYFYNFTHVTSDQQSLTTKFIPPTADSTNETTDTSSAISRTYNQRIYFNLEGKIDSNNSFIFRPNVTIQSTSPNSSSVTNTVDQNDSAISHSIGHSSSENSGFNINGSNFTFRHKFKKAYRTLTLDLTGTANVNDGNGYYASNNTFYKLGSNQNINQHYYDSLHSYSISPTLNYTEPISKHTYLLLSYSYSYNKSTTVNDTYDFDSANQKYSSFDELFSNSYKFTSNSNRISATYRIQNAKLNINFGSGIQFMNFNSLNTTKNIDVSHNYTNLTPTVQFNYSFTNNQRLRIYYMGRTGSPSASQLQPLTTTSDDINFLTGNPELKPQFTHSLRMLYQSFNPSNNHVLFATLNASTTVNDIQNAIVPTIKGGDSTTYINLNGTYSVAGYFNYGWALKHPKSNLNLITDINYSQSQNLVKSSDSSASFQHDYTRSTAFTEKVNWTTNIKKNFDMNFSSNSTYTINRNTLSHGSNLNAFSQVFNAEVTAYTNSGWLIAATLTYTIADNKVPGYNEAVPLLTPSIAKEMFKKKNGELRLTVFDLLHQNTSVNKSVSQNLVSDTRTTTLQQYVMLTFTYNLNNFKGSQHGRMPGQFPGGRFRGGGGNGGGGGGGFRKGN
jgi:Outer membrane protein beta-barrel family/Carboxypeptidase regulatory-like domain